MRKRRWLDDLEAGIRDQVLRDAWYGLRLLRRNPGFSFVVILTLALGMGMNTAIFGVANAVLLRPLSVPEAESLVWFGEYDPNLKREAVASPDFLEWRDQARSFRGMAAYGPQPAAMLTPRQAEHVSGMVVAGDFWQLTNAHPALGKLFDAKAQDTVVIAWPLFENDFGADPAIVGKRVMVDGHAVTITGVLPRDFRFQFPMWWHTLDPQPVAAYFPLPAGDVLRMRNVSAVGLLRPGAGIGSAWSELRILEKRSQAARGAPLSGSGADLRMVPLRQYQAATVRPALLVLLAAGAFVVLIAVLNIANILLARATVRQREIAIRGAVGAGRSRLVRQLLVESLVLALAGCAAGLVLARAVLWALPRIAPDAIPRLHEVGIDGAVLAFALCVSIAAGILFGAAPALAAGRANLHEALKESARTSAGATGRRLRRLLVAGEVALAMVLLAGAGLLLKSFWRMTAHPPGFVPEKILTLKVQPAGPHYREKAAYEGYIRQLLASVQSAPGVETAGVSTWYLFDGVPFPSDSKPGESHVTRLNANSPGYLKALGVRLLRGRWLSEADATGPAVLLNESMARSAFGTIDPLGRQIQIPAPATVVGIVSDLQYSQLDSEAPPEIYIPYQQMPFLPGASVAVRTAGDAAAMAPAIRTLISRIDPTQPVYQMETLEQTLSNSIAPRRFHLFLIATLAGVALLLAMVGIYGVIAYSVAERTREIGVRMALGAQRAQVVRMVVREGLSTSLAGTALGLAGALWLTRLMAGLLYAVQPDDGATFAMVAAVLATTATIACVIPALRAARVDLPAALRYD